MNQTPQNITKDANLYTIGFLGGFAYMFLGSIIYMIGYIATLSSFDPQLAEMIRTSLLAGAFPAEFVILLFVTEIVPKFLLLGGLAWLFKKTWHKDFIDFKAKWIRYGLFIVIGTALILFSTYVIGVVYEWIGIDGGSQNQELIETAMNSALRPLVFLLVVFLAPIFEELIFRKALFGFVTLKLEYRKSTALILSTVLFAIIHVPSLDNMVFIFYYLPLSFIISYAYYKTDNIYVPIALHFLNNLMAFLQV